MIWNNDLFISPIMQKPTISTVWIFFGEKAILEESYEPSLGKLRRPAHFWFLCSRKQLYIPVYLVLSPTVPQSLNHDWLLFAIHNKIEFASF